MFKLQRLEITGFKSFADHTEIVFTGEGITAIVGPNGCGKSNVAEAISWVLGEQRIKNLRSSDMQDVIFLGSSSRAASGMAEVILHLTRDESFLLKSEDGVAAIDSALEEIDESTLRFVTERNTSAQVGESEATLKSDAPAEPVEAVVTDIAVGDTAKHATSLRKRHWRPATIGLEFAPGETVTVARRLYRSGESEYLLNGSECRLRDIQDLFSGTGLSGAQYALIEQGRISQILSSKPMDRRTLIEEAAGITRFRVRQRAAEARLESARTNLRRVTDIIAEIERQVNSLRRQASKARRYRVLREELRDLLKRLFAAEELSINSSLEESSIQLIEVTKEEETLNTRLQTCDQQARAATAQAREVEESLAAIRAAFGEAVLQRDRRDREQAYKREQIATLESRLAEIKSEIQDLTRREEVASSGTDRLRRDELKLKAEEQKNSRILLAGEESYESYIKDVAAAELAVETARSELLKNTGLVERLLELCRQLDGIFIKLAQQSESLAHEDERARQAHETASNEHRTIQSKLKQSKTNLDALISERSVVNKKVDRIRTKVHEREEALDKVREESSRINHRLDSLNELDQHHAYYSEAVGSLLSHDPQGKSAGRDFHCIGTLVDKLRVAPEWEAVVEGGLGPLLQAIIVPTPQDAERAANWLRSTSAGRATFIVAGLHGGSGENGFSNITEESNYSSGVAGIATPELRLADILSTSEAIKSALKNAIPREMDALIVDDLEEAITSSLATRGLSITKQGDWVAAGRLLCAGALRAGQRNEGREGKSEHGLLAFKRELRELKTTSVEIKKELGIAEQEHAQARLRLTETESELLTLNELIIREERAQAALLAEVKRLSLEVERTSRHMCVVTDDAARLAEEIREAQEKKQRSAAETKLAEATRQTAAENVTHAGTALTEIRKKAANENEKLAQLRATTAASIERQRSVSGEIKRLQTEIEDLRNRRDARTTELRETTHNIEELRQQLTELETAAATSIDEIANCQKQIEDASLKLTSSRQTEDKLTEELASANRNLAQARDHRANLDIKRAELQARRNYLHEASMSELGQSLEEILEGYAPEDGFEIETARHQAEELRAKVESFGAVNMMALEELVEMEERFGFLTSQRQDITDAVIATEEALREIKRRSRERFRHAFEQININFRELFIELFGGGRGEMSLLDADDLLESGIDIIAQPPGKRLQNVLLLSGGEKAMAALALILAIFKYRPSPFCLLDEVDAPLDEANIGRFADKLAVMATSTQFIIITHNKRTMETARALYGVTMEEPGVSKLVSVRMD